MAALILEQSSMALLLLAAQTAGVTSQQGRAPRALFAPSRAGNETASTCAQRLLLPPQLHRTTSVTSQPRLPQRPESAITWPLLHSAQFGQPPRCCFEPCRGTFCSRSTQGRLPQCGFNGSACTMFGYNYANAMDGRSCFLPMHPPDHLTCASSVSRQRCVPPRPFSLAPRLTHVGTSSKHHRQRCMRDLFLSISSL